VSRTEQELWVLLEKSWEMPFGDARTALVEEIVRHADAMGLRRLAFDARMGLTAAYHHGGETAKAFTTFSWCLATYDRDPGNFTADDDRHLRWQYKWIVAALRRFPEIPLDRTYRVLDDMERRYRAGGHSLHAVHSLRCLIADHVGDQEQAAEQYRLWNAAPRDENSDCRACDPDSKATHLALWGRDEEAVAIAAPVLDGRDTCLSQPHSILSTLLLPYLRTGRLEEARQAHRRGYRPIRTNREYLGTLAEHLVFCALTGNEARGLELLERHLDWYDRPPDPLALKAATAAGALLLRRLIDLGHADLPLRRPAFGDRPAQEVTVAALEEEFTATATRLVAAFDARNGTDHQSRLLRRLWDTEPFVDYLPLSEAAARHGRPGLAASAAPVAVSGFAGSGTTAPASATASPALSPALGPDELLDLAEQLWEERRFEEAIDAWRRFDELTATGEPTPRQRARRLEGQAYQLGFNGEFEEASQCWEEAARRYADLGEEVAQQAALGRAGCAQCLLPDPRTRESGLALVERSTARIRAVGEPSDRVRAELRLAQAYRTRDRWDEALAALDRATEEVTAEDYLRGDIAAERAQLFLARDDLAGAEAAAGEARAIYRAAGRERGLAHLCYLHGQLLAALSRLDEAMAAFDEGLACLPASEVTMRALLHARRGEALSNAGRADEAIPHLVEAVALMTGRDAPFLPYVRFSLTLAYYRAERYLDAAEAAEELLPELEPFGDDSLTLQARRLLVETYRALGEPDEALSMLDSLAEWLLNKDNTQGAAVVREEMADLLNQTGRYALAAARLEEAAQLFESVNAGYDAVRCHRAGAMSLYRAGQLDEALERLIGLTPLIDALPAPGPTDEVDQGDQADQGDQGATDGAAAAEGRPGAEDKQESEGGQETEGNSEHAAIRWERAALSYDIGYVLVTLGRLGEARQRLQEAAATFRAVGDSEHAAMAEQVLEHLPPSA